MKTENPSSQLKCQIKIPRGWKMAFEVKTNFILFSKTKREAKLVFTYVKTNLASPFSFQLTQNSFHNNEKSFYHLKKFLPVAK